MTRWERYKQFIKTRQEVRNTETEKKKRGSETGDSTIQHTHADGMGRTPPGDT